MCPDILVALSLVLTLQSILETPHSGWSEDEPSEMVTIVITGRIVGADGAPHEGALVASSAGGQAVTDVRGEYRLTTQVPLASSSVELTAIARGHGQNGVAKGHVGITGSGVVSSGVLQLEQGGCCQPGWLQAFGGIPGPGGVISTLKVFDDGDGLALYAGGQLVFPYNHIAKWDGSHWEALGSGMDSPVSALEVFDDGNGPALYAGGYFSYAGGVGASRIARWDGASWSGVGGGLGGVPITSVSALAVFDDGNGPALYVGGSFTDAGGVPTSHIAKWDGSSWSGLGIGVNNAVSALTVFNDGSGPALYVGGSFTSAGGVTASHIAKWDGATWTALGSGMNGSVSVLMVFDRGNGPAMYAGGGFTTADGLEANAIAAWDGSSWSALGSGMSDLAVVRALAAFDDGGGPALYVGGDFSTAGGVDAAHIAKWDGSSWSALGSGINDTVHALTVFAGDAGPALFVGGSIALAGGVPADGIARWDGLSWTRGLTGSVKSFTVFDDGNGAALFAAGGFRTAGGVTMNYIAKWDGSSWSALGNGVDGIVYAQAVYDDGVGPALYAGGLFTSAGGTAANSIAKWNGSSWSTLGNGVESGRTVLALAAFDDGTGPALYAGGDFTTMDGVVVNAIGRWNGSFWSPVGGGMSGGAPTTVAALTVFDDGSGPALYAGGEFTRAGGGSARRIARWDGSSWTALGNGTNGAVLALAAFDDGNGPALYAGGGFSAAGGQAASRVAKWNGSTWSALGAGTDSFVRELMVFDDCSGPALYAGGAFQTAGGVVVNHVAMWDGTSWSALSSGTNGSVDALAAFDEGNGPALFAGGLFSTSGDAVSHGIAEWKCSDTTAPTLNCPDVVFSLESKAGSSGKIVTFDVTAFDACDSSPSVVCVPPSGSFFPRGTTWINCTAADSSGNQSECTFPVVVAPTLREHRL